MLTLRFVRKKKHGAKYTLLHNHVFAGKLQNTADGNEFSENKCRLKPRGIARKKKGPIHRHLARNWETALLSRQPRFSKSRE